MLQLQEGTSQRLDEIEARWAQPLQPRHARAQTRCDGPGLPWVSFHTFRHTCASLLFDTGRNVRQVAEWLGHADPAYTLRTYVHLLDEGLGDAAFLDEVVLTGAADEKPREPPYAD